MQKRIRGDDQKRQSGKRFAKTGSILSFCCRAACTFTSYSYSAISYISFSEASHPRQGSVMDLP